MLISFFFWFFSFLNIRCSQKLESSTLSTIQNIRKKINIFSKIYNVFNKSFNSYVIIFELFCNLYPYSMQISQRKCNIFTNKFISYVEFEKDKKNFLQKNILYYIIFLKTMLFCSYILHSRTKIVNYFANIIIYQI